MKPLPVALLAVLAFVTGFCVAWVVKPSPVLMMPVSGLGSSAPAEPLRPEKPGGAVDYKPIAEALAAENAALEEALRLKDRLIGVMERQIQAVNEELEKTPL